MTATGCFKQKVLLLETIFQKIETQLQRYWETNYAPLFITYYAMNNCFAPSRKSILRFYFFILGDPGTDRSDGTRTYGRNRDNRSLQDAARSTRINFFNSFHPFPSPDLTHEIFALSRLSAPGSLRMLPLATLRYILPRLTCFS